MQGACPHLRGGMGRHVDRQVEGFARADVSGLLPTGNLRPGEPSLRLPAPPHRDQSALPARRRVRIIVGGRMLSSPASRVADACGLLWDG